MTPPPQNMLITRNDYHLMVTCLSKHVFFLKDGARLINLRCNLCVCVEGLVYGKHMKASSFYHESNSWGLMPPSGFSESVKQSLKAAQLCLVCLDEMTEDVWTCKKAQV